MMSPTRFAFGWIPLVPIVGRADNDSSGAGVSGVSDMNMCRIAALAVVAVVASIEPVLAGQTPTPGPIAGVGLASLAIIGGAYWFGRKFFGHKN
jgi:hypothetical protein